MPMQPSPRAETVSAASPLPRVRVGIVMPRASAFECALSQALGICIPRGAAGACRCNRGVMTSAPESNPTHDDESATPADSETAYDASTDPDADPGMLNPRTGGAAGADDGSDAGADPDSDPEMLNPRDDSA